MPQTIDNMSVTWTNSLTTYTGIKLNAAGSSDANSAAGSLLMDLQVGGTSRFSVGKTGGLTFAGNLQVANNGVYIEGTVAGTVRVPGVNGYFGFTTNTSSTSGSTIDLFLTRRAAANLRLGAADTTGTTAPTAQTLSVQSWTSSTNNNQPGANFTIAGSQGTGTGAGGSIIFQVAPAGAVSNGVQNALQNALLIDGDGQATFTIKNTSGTPSLQIAKSGSSSIQITTSATFSVGSSASSLTLNANAGSSPIYAAGSYFNIGTAANNDVQLYRDAANTLALRNGVNAQLLRVYARYDGTNDAYGAMGAAVNLDGTAGDANTLYVGSQKKGSPTALTKLAVQVDGTTRLDYNITNANQWFIHGTVQSGSNFFSGGDVRAAITGSIYWNGRTNITAPADGNLLIGNLAQTDFGRMMFGGTTSSFPAIKRSSTTLQARLADDSGFASVQGKLTTDTAYTAGDPTTTGYLVVYDSAGTAYKIPAVAV